MLPRDRPPCTGDGAQATSALLYLPTGISSDGLGNLFIADQGNAAIRRVNPDGVIMTVAGTLGIAGFLGANYIALIGVFGTLLLLSYPACRSSCTVCYSIIMTHSCILEPHFSSQVMEVKPRVPVYIAP